MTTQGAHGSKPAAFPTTRENVATMSGHLRAAGCLDPVQVASSLVSKLSADDPWSELLSLPTVLLERLFLPPQMDPVSAGKFVRYIVHRSEEEQAGASARSTQQLGPKRALLLAADPVANLKSLARLAAIESSLEPPHPVPPSTVPASAASLLTLPAVGDAGVVAYRRTKARQMNFIVLTALQFQQSFVAQQSQRLPGERSMQSTEQGSGNIEHTVKRSSKQSTNKTFKAVKRAPNPAPNKFRTSGASWMECEDWEMHHLHEQHGNKWAKIASLMTTERNDNAVKNRFSSAAFMKFCEKNGLGDDGSQTTSSCSSGGSSTQNNKALKTSKGPAARPCRHSKRSRSEAEANTSGSGGDDAAEEVENKVLTGNTFSKSSCFPNNDDGSHTKHISPSSSDSRTSHPKAKKARN